MRGHFRHQRTDWDAVLRQAAEIVASYDTPVTLRQTFYRLVATGTIVNTLSSYNRLARLSAEARRDGRFPSLIDGTWHIRRPLYFESPQDVFDGLRGENGFDEPAYRIDRTLGRSHRVLMAAEKSTLEVQLVAWYDERGIPVAALAATARHRCSTRSTARTST